MTCDGCTHEHRGCRKDPYECDMATFVGAMAYPREHIEQDAAPIAQSRLGRASILGGAVALDGLVDFI